MLDLKLTLVLSKNIVLRTVGTNYWALDTNNGNQYKLNEVSYYILNIFRTKASVEQMIISVLSEYKVKKDQLESDCESLINYAISKNILKKGD